MTAKAEPKREGAGDYEVGYGKPPVNRQFKKGEPSPNRNGRRGKRAAEKPRAGEILDGILHEPMRIRKGDRVVAMRPLEVMFRTLLQKAAGGDIRAMKHLLDFAERLGCLKHVQQAMTGVLVVPGMLSVEDFERAAAAHQAPYRGNVGDRVEPGDEPK